MTVIEKILGEVVKTGAKNYSGGIEDGRRDSIAHTLEREDVETGVLGDGPVRVGGADKLQVLSVGIALIVLLAVAAVKLIYSSNDRQMLLYSMIVLAALFLPALAGMIYMWVRAGKGGLVIDGDRLVIKRKGREYSRADIKEAVYSDRGILDLYDIWGTRFWRVRYNEVNVQTLCLWLKSQKIPCRVVRERRSHEFWKAILFIVVGVILMLVICSAYRGLQRVTIR